MMRSEERWTRAAVVVLLAFSIGCGRKNDNRPDAGETSATGSATASVHVADAPPSPASAEDAGVEGSETAEEISDAGADAGRRARRKRRLDAGAGVEAQTSAAPPPAPTAPPPAEVKEKRTGTPMGNDQPYGASAASGAGVLKKTPLPADDPWKK